MNNMEVWSQLAETPEEAKRKISGGRLNGFTDINPMWRLRRLTEVFGPCGIGWSYKVVNQREIAGANGEIALFLDVELQVKVGDQWSAPIPGLGGNMLVAKESGGLRTNDEAYKMALSDAIGTACKALGMSEDVYMSGKGRTGSKYQAPTPPQEPRQKMTPGQAADTVVPFGNYQGQTLRAIFNQDKGYIKALLADSQTPGNIREAVTIMLRACNDRK